MDAISAVAIGQREAETLQLHRHVDGFHRHVWRRLQLRRRKVEDGLHARLHDAIEDVLGRLPRHGHDDDVRPLATEVALDLADIADRHAFDGLADLVGVVVVGSQNDESAMPKAAILSECGTDLSRPYDDDAPLAAEAKNVAQLLAQLGNGVAESALAEGPEKREVLPHLRRRRSPTLPQLFAPNFRQ